MATWSAGVGEKSGKTQAGPELTRTDVQQQQPGSTVTFPSSSSLATRQIEELFVAPGEGVALSRGVTDESIAIDSGAAVNTTPMNSTI